MMMTVVTSAATIAISMKAVSFLSMYTLMFYISACRSHRIGADADVTTGLRSGQFVANQPFPFSAMINQNVDVVSHDIAQDTWIQVAHEDYRRSFKNYFSPLSSTTGNDTDEEVVCARHISCKNRCVLKVSDEDADLDRFSCHCDPLCDLYGDCCKDYNQHCKYSSSLLDGFQETGKPERMECVHLPPHPLKYVHMIGSCPANESSNEMDSIARKCEVVFPAEVISSLPVTGKDLLTYRNVYCAQCNGVEEVTFWTTTFSCGMPILTISTESHNIDFGKHCLPIYQEPDAGLPLRPCTPVVDACYVNQSDNSVVSQCRNYEATVRDKKSGTFYKNTYCALCNTVGLQNMECPQWISQNGTISGEFMLELPGRVISVTYALPPSLSVLLNFGIDEDDFYYYTQNWLTSQHRCPDGHIYDTYAEKCREVYCEEGFSIENWECVGSVTTTTEKPWKIECKLSIKLIVEVKDEAGDKDVANRTMMLKQILHELIDEHDESSHVILADVVLRPLEGTDESLVEVTFTLVTELLLIVSMKAIEIVLRMWVEIIQQYWEFSDEFNIRTFSVEFDSTNPTNETSWCFGVEKWYPLDMVSVVPILNETDHYQGYYITALDTGIAYMTGQYVTDIKIEGSKTDNTSTDIDGSIWVCDRHPKISTPCMRILIEPHEYEILLNRSLVFQESQYTIDEYEFSSNGTVFICNPYEPLDPSLWHPNYETWAYIESILSVVLLSISLLALLITFLTYIIFPQLRNLPKLCLMNLAGCLFIAEFFFLVFVQEKFSHAYCIATALILHYFFLASFMWMNVMAYDLFKTFEPAISRVRDISECFHKYALYAYSLPAMIVLTALSLELIESITFSPGYAMYQTCWITDTIASIIFFGVPILLILFSNFYFFVCTIRNIRASLRMAKKLRKSDEHLPNVGRRDVRVYIRMSTFMGFTWIFGFAAATVFGKVAPLWILFNLLFILFNSLQGTFLFCAFILSRQTREHYRDLFNWLLTSLASLKISNMPGSPETSANLKRAINRKMGPKLRIEKQLSTISMLPSESSPVPTSPCSPPSFLGLPPVFPGLPDLKVKTQPT